MSTTPWCQSRGRFGLLLASVLLSSASALPYESLTPGSLLVTQPNQLGPPCVPWRDHNDFGCRAFVVEYSLEEMQLVKKWGLPFPRYAHEGIGRVGGHLQPIDIAKVGGALLLASHEGGVAVWNTSSPWLVDGWLGDLCSPMASAWTYPCDPDKTKMRNSTTAIASDGKTVLLTLSPPGDSMPFLVQQFHAVTGAFQRNLSFDTSPTHLHSPSDLEFEPDGAHFWLADFDQRVPNSTRYSTNGVCRYAFSQESDPVELGCFNFDGLLPGAGYFSRLTASPNGEEMVVTVSPVDATSPGSIVDSVVKFSTGDGELVSRVEINPTSPDDDWVGGTRGPNGMAFVPGSDGELLVVASSGADFPVGPLQLLNVSSGKRVGKSFCLGDCAQTFSGLAFVDP